MTKYNTLNVKLSNSQINKLKPEIKNGTCVTLNLSSNSADEIQLLLLTNTQVSRIRKASANDFFFLYQKIYITLTSKYKLIYLRFKE